jgi:hypothetical protein
MRPGVVDEEVEAAVLALQALGDVGGRVRAR